MILEKDAIEGISLGTDFSHISKLPEPNNEI